MVLPILLMIHIYQHGESSQWLILLKNCTQKWREDGSQKINYLNFNKLYFKKYLTILYCTDERTNAYSYTSFNFCSNYQFRLLLFRCTLKTFHWFPYHSTELSCCVPGGSCAARTTGRWWEPRWRYPCPSWASSCRPPDDDRLTGRNRAIHENASIEYRSLT